MSTNKSARLSKGSRYVSPIQKKMMMSYLRRNPELLSPKFSVRFNFKDAQLKWTEMASILNRMPGGRKNWKLWRKTWHDLRSKAKQKQQQGGSVVISQSDKAILNLIGEGKSTKDNLEYDYTKYENDEDEFGDDVSYNNILSTIKEEPLYFGKNQKNVIFEVLSSESKERVCENSTILNDPSFEGHDYDASFEEVEKEPQSISKLRYQETKLNILNRIAMAKEKSAAAKERIASALEKIAETRTDVL